MTHEEIAEGNRIMAQVMGLEWLGEKHLYGKQHKYVVKDSDGYAFESSYHESCDALMPVWKKFSNLQGMPLHGFHFRTGEISEWILLCDFEQTYKALVSAWKWVKDID